ncbi:uncharacterized protein YALI1_A11303g [Yarrowia lipolytica]|uniref:Uncharacterized protein n=1 Tax=Yarrowia lipolytica TaxID=4952 RepID=A0A1D8N4F3_YARLL|nr:hypothetical protein YALI1_A11303g [Yarrowia lipolytica]
MSIVGSAIQPSSHSAIQPTQTVRPFNPSTIFHHVHPLTPAKHAPCLSAWSLSGLNIVVIATTGRAKFKTARVRPAPVANAVAGSETWCKGTLVSFSSHTVQCRQGSVDADRRMYRRVMLKRMGRIERTNRRARERVFYKLFGRLSPLFHRVFALNYTRHGTVHGMDHDAHSKSPP